MDRFFSTKQVASILKLKPDYISKAVWQERIKPPAKSPSGNFLWTDDDINRASWALLHSAYEPQRRTCDG